MILYGRIMIFRILILFCFFSFSCVYNINAQDKVKTTQDTELEQKAFTLFRAENYTEALPLFSQLLSLYPKEPNYNFGYAVCLIETNQQIEKAIKYLQFADSKSDNPLIKFYLGRAFHLSYKFDEALTNYEAYSKKALPADKKKYLLDSRIAMCNNGKELIRYISDLTVVDNKKIKNDNFYYSYELKDFGGKLIVKPPEFKTKLDKKYETVNNVIFFPNNGNEVFYGSFGENKANGREIFNIKKNLDGTWSKPVNIGSVINTPYDEDYAFLQADGKTLYFSSKGHNSMGGYDIFKSVFDSTANAWTKPINLDFPTNTPYDDYLFITDKDELYAYFASNRETNGDNISVYKIVVDKKPVERQFNNIDEILNTSKLEVSTLADIKKAENSHNDANNKQLLTNNVSNNNNQLTSTNYKFKPITYSPNITTQQLSSEVDKDEKEINNQANNLRKQSDIAYLSAIEKNNQANNKRKLASDKTNELSKITDINLAEKKKQEIFDLITDAENLENNAVTAYNVAKNLDQVATDIEKDAAKTKNIKEAINNSDNVNNESLVEVVNKNKDQLNKSQNKYTTIENEIENRTSLANNMQTEFLQNEKEYNANLSDISSTEDEVNTLKQQIDNETDNAKKTELVKQLEDKNKQLEVYNAKDSILEDSYEKSKIVSENLQEEVKFLKGLQNNVSADNRSTQDLALLTKNINKDQLHKDIFDKELTVDVKNANAVLNNNNLTANNSNNNQQNNVKINNQVTNNADANNLQTESLYVQAEKNKKIADSLQNVISAKEKAMTAITDPKKHAAAYNEIAQLNDLKDLKTKQSEDLLKQAKANDKMLASNNNTNIYNNNSVFPFNSDNSTNTNQDSKLVTYQKEVLNAQYYENLVREQRTKVDMLKYSLTNTTDANSKSNTEKQIAELNKEIEKNTQIRNQSKANVEKLHKEAVSEIDANTITNEQLVLNATQYKMKSELNLTNEQKQVMSLVENDREFLKGIQKNCNEITAEIDELIKKRETADLKTQKQIDKDLISKREKQAELIKKYSTVSMESNQDAAVIYKDVIDANKKVDITNPDIRLANMLDKEAEIYFEKAANVRKDAELLGKPEEILLEYNKADNIEQIAIQKQKYSIDLFKKSQTNLIANNGVVNNSNNVNNVSNPNTNKNFNTISADTNLVPRTVAITLNPDEENQLKSYNTETHKADVLLAESKKSLTDIESKKNKAAATFSAKEKQQLLKGIDSKEQKALDQMLNAYNYYGRADSMKYMVYKNQIKQLENSPSVIGNNKSIAKQYTSEADFYFDEATKIRQNANSITDKNARADELKRATDFEKKALSSQEYAVDVLTDVNPVFFVSTNDLTKVDRLDVLNQPVDVNEIVRIKTSRIVEKLTLTEEELIRLDEAEKKRAISNQLINDANKYLANLDSLKKIVELPANAKDKKKAEKQIPKVEKDMFASQFTSAELNESINDARFYLYKENFKKTRLNDNTTEARQGKQLEKDANAKYSKAKSLREKSYMKEDARKAYEIAVQANTLEQEAIEDQERAYGIYLNLKPLDDEIKEYALKNQKKNNNQNQNLLVRTNADITHIETPDIDTTSQIVAVNQNNINPVDTTTKSNLVVENITTPVDTAIVNNNIIENNNTNNNVVVNNVSPVDTTTKSNLVVENVTVPVDTTSKANNNVVINNVSPVDTTTKSNLVVENITVPNDTTSKANNNVVINNVSPVDTTTKSNLVVENITVPIDTTTKTNNNVIENITTNNNIVTNNTSNVDNPPVNNNAITQALNKTGFGFSILPVNAYSAASPIPMNVPLPDGIVFKVQIGAFKAPVKNEAFKGLNPISGETLAGSQYVRYYVGLFYSEDAANIVKNQIKPIGYNDAFVVAYKDGKRISLFDARRMLKENGKTEEYNLLAQAEVNKIKNRAVENPVNQNINNNQTNNNTVNQITLKQPVNTTNVSNVSGLFYTVQIGVYKSPVTAQDLKNLSPIYEEQAYGFIRYTTGKYSDFKKADLEKNRIIQLGIPDAFVSAYYNGKRISVAEATKIEMQNPASATDQIEVKYPEQNVEVNQNANLPVDKTAILFKVQIGAFKEQIPVNKVTQFLEMAANHGLDHERDETGSNVYSVGKFKTYDEAVKMRDVLINEGVQDAFVVAYNGKVKISVNDAKNILNQ